MRTIRKISMIGATFLLAAATGHVMQSVGPRPQLGASLVASSVSRETWRNRVEPREEPRVQLISKTVLRNPPVYHFATDPGVGQFRIGRNRAVGEHIEQRFYIRLFLT